MVTTNKNKKSIDDTRIRKLLQKDDFLYDKNNKTLNQVYKKEYEMTMNSHI